MKQLTKVDIENLFKENNVELKSTHSKLCLPIINRIYRKMVIEIKFPSIKVYGDLIIDGHHRYLASLLAAVKLEKDPSNKTSATEITDWNAVVFDDEDWDTEAKIKMLNEQDARFNNMSIEEISNHLK
jgi:hypothetical protein